MMDEVHPITRSSGSSSAEHETVLSPGSSGVVRPGALLPDSIPGYELIREIHSGAQGVVYQAIQKSTQRRVALKIARQPGPGLSVDTARFEREVRILAQLNHPNIVSIHDSGSVGSLHYFAMNYISGLPLDEWRVAKPRTVEDILRVFVKMCDAVNAAHLRGVIHRDLKPSNIRVDTKDQPHVLDFGLAKVSVALSELADQVTQTRDFLGSVPWCSPEQIEGVPAQIDVRTDVYSLGVILFQLLTGRFPYEVVGNVRDVFMRITNDEPLRPSALSRQINNEVETIALKCLAKSPERRYQSAGELGRDVNRYLAGEPIEAKRDSFAYVLRKQIRRHALASLTAGAFLVLILLSTGVSTWLWQRAEAQRDAAVSSEQRAIIELNNTSAMTAFLMDMFTAGESGTAWRNDLTVRELLDQAVAVLDQRPPGPVAEAELRFALGRSYCRLSRYPEAEKQLERSRALFEQQMQSGWPWAMARNRASWLAATDALAEVMLRQKRPAEGFALREEVAASLSSVADGRSTEYARVLVNMAADLRELSRVEEAEERLAQAIEIMESTPGSDPLDLAGALNTLGAVRLRAGRAADAEPVLRRALELRRARLPAEDRAIAATLLNLSAALRDERRFEEGLPLALEARDILLATLGRDNADTAGALAHAGALCLDLGRAEEAERFFRECLEVRQQLLAPGDWMLPSTRSMLGGALSELGRLEEAEPLLRDAWEALRGGGALVRRERVREACERMARLYELQGRQEDARAQRAQCEGL
jgi:serine/threonine protein kinase